MTTTELLAIFRQEMFDVELPYLWSDALVYTYIDDAQKQFCRDTYGIADARSFKINILADGTEWYKTDVRILKIRSIIRSDTGRDIPLVPVEKMDGDMRFDGALGPVKALVSGLEKNVLRAWPKPNQAATLELRTFRLPTTVGTGDDFEVDDQHVLPLLFWVKHKAYDVQDGETFDRNASDKFRARHDAYCAAVKNEQSRAMHPVGVVNYGGL